MDAQDGFWLELLSRYHASVASAVSCPKGVLPPNLFLDDQADNSGRKMEQQVNHYVPSSALGRRGGAPAYALKDLYHRSYCVKVTGQAREAFMILCQTECKPT